MSVEPGRALRDEAYWKAKFTAPRPEFDEQTLRWRCASLGERGRALAGLLRFVDAAGRYPPKQEMFPGFPRSAWYRQPRERGGVSMLSFAERVLQLSAAPGGSGIPFAFGDAIARNYYAEPRATTGIEINIFFAETAAESALSALKGLDVAIDLAAAAERTGRDGQIRLLWDATFVDLFFSTVPSLDSAAGRTRLVPYGGQQIPILLAKDLFV